MSCENGMLNKKRPDLYITTSHKAVTKLCKPIKFAASRNLPIPSYHVHCHHRHYRIAFTTITMSTYGFQTIKVRPAILPPKIRVCSVCYKRPKGPPGSRIWGTVSEHPKTSVMCEKYSFFKFGFRTHCSKKHQVINQSKTLTSLAENTFVVSSIVILKP